MKFGYFVACSVLVHVVLFASIFDIYFTSPLVRGTSSFHVDQHINASARRLVLFVADGLRAETFYNKSMHDRSPFLSDIMKYYGTWGVSHTHIPTESRPGHVALIAGFYEDVSAIMRGWKENPVEFDSVFNQSRETWSWGSPDILPMFAKGSSGDHVHIHCYHGDTETFAGDDSSKLDTWVFDRFQEFFKNASNHPTLHDRLHQDKIVFFLHLLGIDSNGHSHKPNSKEYLDNIKIVDEGISNVTKLLDEFYKYDGKTSYIFTADHGMTDWGSHGAGLPSETLTPLVAWGAGISSPSALERKSELLNEDIDMTKSWGLNYLDRHDVEQADVSALMSAVLGISFPVNSVGSLPLPYLSGSAEHKTQLARMNAKQIAEQFAVKLRYIEEHSIKTFFRPFPKLSVSDVAQADIEISSLIGKEEYTHAIKKSKELIDSSLEGLRYYHTYDRTLLYFSVMSSFVGWICITVLLGIKQISVMESQAMKLKPIHLPTMIGYDRINVIFAAIFAFATIMLLVTISPWTYYVYCLLPVPIWYWIASERFLIRATFNALVRNRELTKGIFVYGICGIIGIWILIASFFHRNFLSPGLLALSTLPKLCSGRSDFSILDKLWVLACFCIAIFPNLPTIGRSPNMNLVMCGGIAASILCILISMQGKVITLSKSLLYALPILTSIIVLLTSDQSTSDGTVSHYIHVLSWVILLLSWVAPTFSSTNMQERLLSLYVWQMSAYMLLSLSYDALFCVILCGLLHIWIHLEHSITSTEEKNQVRQIKFEDLDFRLSHITLGDESVLRQPKLSDVRRSFMLVFFLVVAFFGVGNIASINSFDVQVVLPFITIFDPFVMGGLLAYKVLMPYLLVACSFCGIALSTRMPLRTLCCIVMVISDVMAMHFVFMIKDHGSWLDIGTSISHFVIVMSMITSLLLFFVVANFLTTFSFFKVNKLY
ncbi:GPI ethanolamine phosphate transferase 1-like [Styela clava]